MLLFVSLFLSFGALAQTNAEGEALTALKKEISKLTSKSAESEQEKPADGFYKYERAHAARAARISRAAKAEMQAGDFEKNFLSQLRRALETGEVGPVEKYLAADVSFPIFSGLAQAKERAVDGISIKKMQKLPSTSGVSGFKKNLSSLAAEYSKIEFVSLDLAQLDNSSKSNGRVWATTLLDIRGLDQAGKRRNDKAVMVLDLTGFGSAWMKLRGISVSELTSVTLMREPAFARVAKNAGFDQAKTYQRLEALRRGGYAFAVEDFNNDGKLDAFVGSYGESTLWLGEDNFKFKRLNHRAIDLITLAKGAAFVDLDGDGWKDLIISRFAADQLKGDLLVFRNKQGSLEEVKDVFASGILRDYAMPMAIADFNSDGLLDVYVGFPGSLDFSSKSPTRKAGTSVHGLFMNQGGFKFSDQTPKMENFDAPNMMPHGALASDFNMDGKVDVLIMDDQANVGPIYKNDGFGRFALSQEESQIVNIGFGMGISGGDFNNDGLLDYAVTNASFRSLNRMERFHYEKSNPVRGLRLFMGQKSGKFAELTDASLGDSGQGEGGVTVIDYDNDGNQDLYVVNGLWSGSSRDEKIDSIFAVGKKAGLAHVEHMQDGLGDRFARGGARSIFMKALMEARIERNGRLETMSLAGYQRNRLLKNLGGGEFIDVGYLENVDSMADGYMSLVADVNRDGSPDLLLRNCDPGTDARAFPVVEAFQNNHKNKKMLTVSLKGKASNSMGVGAKVHAKIGGKDFVREVAANNSAVQGEVSAFFGMADQDRAEKVTIQWPSGAVETYENVKAGRHIFEENTQVKVSQK